jgi:hypothetical protein
VKGFKKYCTSISSALWIRLMINCGMAVKRMGMSAVSARQMETVTLIGKGR